MGAALDLLLYGGDHLGMGVAEQQRTVAHRVVEDLAPVDEPFVRPLRAHDIERWLVLAGGVGDADGPAAPTRRLDALGGGAALMVVAYHANGLLAVPGGLRANVLDDVRFNLDSGVELFFVLSGYLIALPFLRALVSGGELPGIA